MNNLRVIFLGVLLLFVSSVQASALFEGRNANLWLLDVGDSQKNAPIGRITSFSHDRWLTDFLDNQGQPLYALQNSEVALINTVANSSAPLGKYQPALSLTGLGSADFQLGQHNGQAMLVVEPAEGTYHQTIAVRVQVDPALLLSASTQLTWTINGKPKGNVLLKDLTINHNGVYEHTFYLVKDGIYDVALDVRDAQQSLAGEQRRYTLQYQPDANNGHLPPGTASDGYFRRDTDGDGLPDLVEADIGLDPFTDDWRYDADQDGWSEFDLWLRKEHLDSHTALPLDTDQDGWSDFDETLRGTQADAPNVNLGEGFSSVRDMPSARRLYEVEYLLESSDLPDEPVQNGAWQQFVVADIHGQWLYDSTALLDEPALQGAQLDAAHITPRVQARYANDLLSRAKTPSLRLPAGMSTVLNARYEKAGYHYHYKQWLARQPDVNPAGFSHLTAGNQWDDAQAWRQAFTRWLTSTLTQPLTPKIESASTRLVHYLEALLSRELALNGERGWLLFAETSVEVPTEFIKTLEGVLSERFAVASLDVIQQQLATHLSASGYLKALDTAWLASLQDWSTQATQGRALRKNSSAQAISYFLEAYDADVGACLVDETGAFIQEDTDCSVGVTQSDLDTLESVFRERQYGLRLYLLPGSWALLAQNPVAAALTDSTADFDADDLSNYQELNTYPLALSTSPLQADSDGDAQIDSTDLCPADKKNTCTGQSFTPMVMVDDVQLGEPEKGEGFAWLAVTLQDVTDIEVKLRYMLMSGEGDTAQEGVDFVRLEGEIMIPAGQRTAFIRIPLLADNDVEDPETFRVVFTDVVNAVLPTGRQHIRVTLTDYVPDNNQVPVVVLAQTALTVDERSAVTLDASGSYDPEQQDLSFRWQRVDNNNATVELGVTDHDHLTFTAPIVLSETRLQFQVTVSDSEGGSAQGLVDVNVRPVNDAPIVDYQPVYQVKQGETLTLPWRDLLSAVSDPEGEALIIKAVKQVPDGGRFSTENVSYRFKAFSGETLLSSDTQSVQGLGEQAVVMVEGASLSGDGAPEVIQVDLDNGAKTLLGQLQGGGSSLGWLTSLKQPTFYLDDFASQRRYRYHPDVGLSSVATSSAYGLLSAFIDESSGDVWFCDGEHFPNVWSRLNAQNLSATASGLECDAYIDELPRADWHKQVFVGSGASLLRTDETQGMVLVKNFSQQQYSSTTVRAIVPHHDALLIFVSNAGVDSLQYEIWRYQADGSLTLWQTMANSSQATPLWAVAGDTLYFVLEEKQNLQLWTWDVSSPGSVPVRVMADFLPARNTFELGRLRYHDGSLYLLVQISQTQNQLFTIDTTQSTFALNPWVALDAAGGSAPMLLDVRDDQVFVMQTGNNFLCQLLGVEPMTGNTALLADGLFCNEPLQHYQQLVYSKQAGSGIQRLFYRYDGKAATGEQRLLVEVSDPEGLTVELPVTITIKEVTP